MNTLFWNSAYLNTWHLYLESARDENHIHFDWYLYLYLII